MESHHVFNGEEDGRPVADWLNRNRGTKDGDAVIEVVKSIQELIPKLSLKEWIRQDQFGMSPRQYLAALNKLNQRLSKYSMWPMFLRRSTQIGKWRKTGVLQVRSKFHWKWSYGGNPAATETVHRIAKLGGQGLFFRLRQCSLCRDWIYARFGHQEYCSSRCREKHLKSGPKWRAYRREYMREHRQKERLRAAASLKRLDKIAAKL